MLTTQGFHGSINSEKYWFRYGTPLSKDDHGTHVAGTIHFMAPKAEIYDYRVFGEDGDIDGNTAVVKSIRHAVDKTKCHVINMSLSVGYPVRTDIQKAIQYAYKKGVHMVCAAGNDGDGNPTTDEIYSYPAIYKETISVAAVHKEDGFLLDATTFSESNSSINYSGIGSNVVSLKPGGGIQTMSGTSMAAPHITGLIACLMSNNNSTKYNTDKKLRTLLNTTYVIDIGEEGYDKQTGKGFLSYLVGNESDKDDFIDLLSFVAN
jgi:subtilisin family serine protease